MNMENKTTIGKNKEGYGYKYTELAQINKYCEDNGIRYVQEIETNEVNGQDYILTTIIKDGEEKKYRGCQIVKAVLSGIKNPVQEYGSSLTYCRRYSLLMSLGLATEDSDASEFTEPQEITKEYAENFVIGFGKYKGKKLTELEGNSWIEWARSNADEEVKACINILYPREELSDEDEEVKLRLMADINTLMIETDSDFESVMEHYGVKSTSSMTLEQLKDCKNILEKKKERK